MTRHDETRIPIQQHAGWGFFVGIVDAVQPADLLVRKDIVQGCTNGANGCQYRGQWRQDHAMSQNLPVNNPECDPVL